jgi:hypothetical protein
MRGCPDRTVQKFFSEGRAASRVGVGRPAGAEGVGRKKFFLLSKLFRSRDQDYS